MYSTIKNLHQRLEEVTDLKSRIAILSELAFCYLNTDPIKGNDALQEMLRLSEEAQYDEGIAEAHNGMARLRLRTMEHEQALVHYQQAAEKLQYSENWILLGKVFDGLGMTFATMGQVDKAIVYFRQAIDFLNRDENAGVHAAKVMNNLGNAWFRKGDEEEAERIYRRGLQVLADNGQLHQGTFLSMNLGILLNKTGRQKLAMELFQECLEQFTEKGHKLGIAGAQLCIGRTYMSQRKHAEAMNYIQVALASFKQLGNLAYLADAYCTLGEMYYRLKGHTEAEEQLRKAHDMFTELHYPEGIIESGIVLGKTLAASNRQQEATHVLQECHQLAQKHGMQRFMTEISRIQV